MDTEANKDGKSQKSNSSLLGSVLGAVAEVAEGVGKSASQATQAVVKTATKIKQDSYRSKVPIEYYCFLDLVTDGN